MKYHQILLYYTLQKSLPARAVWIEIPVSFDRVRIDLVTACEGSVDRNEVMSNGKPEITVTACEAVWFESIVKSHNT